MLDDLFQADNLRGAQDLIANPKPLPKPSGPAFSAWRLTAAAPRGVAAGAAQSGGFFADVLGAFGQVGGATYTGDLFGNMTDQQRKETGQAAQTLRTTGMDFSSEGGDLLRGVAKGYSPDPESAHTAERLVFDFARFASKAVGYTVAGGPVIGPALTAADEGMAAADELKQQGVDIATRTKAGAVIGAVSGLSVALPMAGRTMAETAALVATGGPLSFMGQQQSVRSILQAADYSKLAEQYDPFDPVGLAVSTLVPAAFGVHGLRVNRAAAAAKAAEDFRAGPVPSAETPTAAAARETMAGRPADEHVDAARTLLALEQRRESSPFRADDWRGYDLHETAMARAIDQMAAGEPVRVNDVLAFPDLTAARATLDQIDVLQAERAQLLPEAAALAEPGAIREARAELRLMEQDRPDTSESGMRALAKQIQEQQGVSYKAALSDARKQLDGALQDFEARQARLNRSIEENAKAQQATKRVGELDQRITDLEKQLGPEAKLARFDRDMTANMRALVENTRPTQRPANAKAPEAGAAPAKPQAPDAASPGRPAAQARADQGPGAGAAASEARLVDDGAATRVAQIEAEMPDLMVMMDGMDAPRPLAEVLAAVKAEADDMKLDGYLMRAAAECALFNGR